MLATALNFGCTSTVAPGTNTQRQASFDSIPDTHGNYQNSGVLGVTNHLWIITPTARARYDWLIVNYGSKIHIVPALTPDDGLKMADTNTLAIYHATNLWIMDGLHVQYWATMNSYATMPAQKKSP